MASINRHGGEKFRLVKATASTGVPSRVQYAFMRNGGVVLKKVNQGTWKVVKLKDGVTPELLESQFGYVRDLSHVFG